MKVKRFLAVAILAVAAVAGLGILGAQGQAPALPPQMAEMMKKMMMNRPKAMVRADEAVQRQKQQAAQQGKYTCCLRHPCDHCAMKMGQCPCGPNATKGMPVCNECKGSWYAGDGAIQGKSADDIKTLPRPPMM